MISYLFPVIVIDMLLSQSYVAITRNNAWNVALKMPKMSQTHKGKYRIYKYNKCCICAGESTVSTESHSSARQLYV